MKSMDSKQCKIANKRITKSCKSCSKQVPTACKACPCGFRFRKALAGETMSDPAGSVAPETVKSGRIQRTRRERPHFFDSLEYGTHIRRKRVQSSAVDQTGSKLHRWSRASASAKAAKNKLVARKFKSNSQASSTNMESVSTAASQAPDLIVAKDAGNSIGGSSSSCSSRDEDTHCRLSSEKALHYSIILAEINRKYSSINFHPS